MLPVVQDLFATEAGYYPAGARHDAEQPEGSAEAALLYCLSGNGWCQVGGGTWVLREGWTLLLPPLTPYVYGTCAEVPWSVWHVRFGGARLPAYLQMVGVSSTHPVFYAPDVEVMVQGFEELYGHLGAARDGSADAVLPGLSTTLAYLLGRLRFRQHVPDERRRANEEKIMASLRYMRAHLSEPCQLDVLAAAAQMSVSHYAHLFKQQMNTPPVHFFIRLKMQRACELLGATDQPVGEVAAQVGYGDPFQFCRMFKKVVGTAPTRYRAARRRPAPHPA